jgi:hypothetical protein
MCMVSKSKSKRKGKKTRSSKSSKAAAKKNTRLKNARGARAARSKKVSLSRQKRSPSSTSRTLQETYPLAAESTGASPYEPGGESPESQEELQLDTSETMGGNKDVGEQPTSTELSDNDEDTQANVTT